jgi:hypothetical protein
MTTKVMDGKRETLAQYLAGMLESGSDGVGGDWEAGEAARAVEYEAEQWLKQSPPATQLPPDTGGEWRVEAMPTRGWRVVDATGQEVVADVYRKEDAARVVSDHNAVQFALHFGRNWTLTDWQNWLRWHATKERQ